MTVYEVKSNWDKTNIKYCINKQNNPFLVNSSLNSHWNLSFSLLNRLELQKNWRKLINKYNKWMLSCYWLNIFTKGVNIALIFRNKKKFGHQN